MLNNVTIHTKRERDNIEHLKYINIKRENIIFFFNIYLLIITIFKAPRCIYIITILEANV